MISALLGKKLGMTQLCDEKGILVPVTVIEAGPCHIMQIKVKERDGYNAVQLGFDERRRKNATKPESGHARAAKVEPKKFIREVRTDEVEALAPGQAVKVDIFEDVASVDVIGTTKGRGFQGTMKRHNFHGHPASHGASKVHRAPGSIGQASDPSRVFKGTKMPGHMGNVRRTARNLKVFGVQSEKNLLLLQGSVPGANGVYLIVRGRPKREVRHK